MAVLEEALCELLCHRIPCSLGPIAAASREAAEGLLEWIRIDCNRDSVETFTSEVLKALDRAFPGQRSSQASLK